MEGTSNDNGENGEVGTILQAVAEAFAEDASGALPLTATGIEIRQMADGSGKWAVFANGIGPDGHEIYRRRVCYAEGFSRQDVGSI